ncbi:unnamed protein product [Candidula unifasciata]|uniref:BHLH domain-containing protein n=1 Tax=Candidula unifasciata TaxID=100452 RepID=A0A8S3Z1C7_9EUPU|nr:unnamed protein product [Candidula unifasciata]
MAAEADTSGSELPATSRMEHRQYRNISQGLHHQRHHQEQQRYQQLQHFYHTDVTSSDFSNHSHSSEAGDGEQDHMEKLISVDEFDDSDHEDNRSCSTASPTLSDHTINSSFSSRNYNPRDNSVDRKIHKLRKKGAIASKVLDDQDLQSLRLKINSRERKRMHDLNSALDGLREVMPYAHGPSVRKLSKIATLLLAKNYILMLNSSLDEMKKLVSDIYQNQGSSRPTTHHLPTQPLLSAAAAAASSSSSGVPASKCAESSTTHLHNVPHKTNSKGEPSSSFSTAPTTIPMAPLPAHHHHHIVNPLLPLSLPTIRGPIPGFTAHDIAALTTSYTLHKSESSSSTAMPQTYSGHDRAHPFHRWPVPCACAQCLSGSTHLPLDLQLGRITHPLLTSSAFLHRKN